MLQMKVKMYKKKVFVFNLQTYILITKIPSFDVRVSQVKVHIVKVSEWMKIKQRSLKTFQFIFYF